MAGRWMQAWVEWRGYVLDPTMHTIAAMPGWGAYRPCWGHDMRGKYRSIETPPDIRVRRGEDRGHPVNVASTGTAR